MNTDRQSSVCSRVVVQAALYAIILAGLAFVPLRGVAAEISPRNGDVIIGETGRKPRKGGDVVVGETGVVPPRGGDVVIGETGVRPPGGGDVIIGETGVRPPRNGGVIIGETGVATPGGDDIIIGETNVLGRSRYDPPGHGIIIPVPRPPVPYSPYFPGLPPPQYYPYPPYYPYESSYERGRAINAGGVNAYGRGDYHGALQQFHIAKDMGYPAAFTNIGVCYQNGLGVPQNYYEAAKWFYEASLRGHEAGRQYLHNLVVAGLVPPPPYSEYSYYPPPPVPTPGPVYASPEGGRIGATLGASNPLKKGTAITAAAPEATAQD